MRARPDDGLLESGLHGDPVPRRLPDDLRFVVGLHEGSVVGIATGYALGRDAPAFALLHTTAGLGNAVAALATARVNRAPLVVMVGQQDRRHVAQEPFLAGPLDGLAGDYPVWVEQPARAQDVPGALVRAYQEAATARGPAILIVPMDDWPGPAPEAHEVLGPERLVRARAAAPIFRQFAYGPGPLVDAGTRLAQVTDDPAEAHRSPSELTVLSDPAAVCGGLAERLEQRDAAAQPARTAPAPPSRPEPGEPLRAGHVFAALAERLAPDAVVVEECPSNRPELNARLPTRAPLGLVSAAMGGLGFALPGTIGLRMVLPERPVLAVAGDGASMYAIQALWSAAHYGVGALFVVIANGRYAVMGQLASPTGKPVPSPPFDTIDICAMARALGCAAIRIEDHDHLLATFDEVLPTPADRDEPLLLEVVIAPS